jgi:hypothetical protein
MIRLNRHVVFSLYTISASFVWCGGRPRHAVTRLRLRLRGAQGWWWTRLNDWVWWSAWTMYNPQWFLDHPPGH